MSGALCTSTWLLVLCGVASAARAAPVAIEAVGPQTMCPDPSMVDRGVSAELFSAAPTATAWRLVYRVERPPGGQSARRVVRFDLRDQDGRVHLERAVSDGAGDCEALAEAIALIVGRFFEALGWTAGRPLPPALAISRSGAPVGDPTRFRLAVEAGAGLWTRRHATGTGVFGVRLERGPVEVAVRVLAPAAGAREDRPGGGTAVLSAWAAALSAGVGWQRERMRLHGGPLAVACRQWARTDGIAVPRKNAATTWAAGLAAGASFALSAHWRVGVEGWASRAAFGDRFVVAGWGPVLAPPRFQGAAFGRVAYAFSP